MGMSLQVSERRDSWAQHRFNVTMKQRGGRMAFLGRPINGSRLQRAPIFTGLSAVPGRMLDAKLIAVAGPVAGAGCQPGYGDAGRITGHQLASPLDAAYDRQTARRAEGHWRLLVAVWSPAHARRRPGHRVVWCGAMQMRTMVSDHHVIAARRGCMAFTSKGECGSGTNRKPRQSRRYTRRLQCC